MTLVIDSNVLLSALAGHPGSPSAKLLTGIRAGSVQAVACQRLITELREGLRKPYFAERVSEREAEEAVAAIERAVSMQPDPADPAATLRDPRDDYLVALARAAGAEASSRATRICSSRRPPATSLEPSDRVCATWGAAAAPRE